MSQRNEKPIGLSSIEDVRSQFVCEGISINAWAKAHGFKTRTVYAVLQGQLECRHGVSHKIAVELGLKATPTQKLLKLGTA